MAPRRPHERWSVSHEPEDGEVRGDGRYLSIGGVGLEAGEVDPTPTASIPRVVHTDLARLRELSAPGLPDEVLARALLAWSDMFGLIGYELFGHLHRVIEGYDAFFEHEMRRSGPVLVVGG